jgi:hypothetical protein
MEVPRLMSLFGDSRKNRLKYLSRDVDMNTIPVFSREELGPKTFDAMMRSSRREVAYNPYNKDVPLLAKDPEGRIVQIPLEYVPDIVQAKLGRSPKQLTIQRADLQGEALERFDEVYKHIIQPQLKNGDKPIQAYTIGPPESIENKLLKYYSVSPTTKADARVWWPTRVCDPHVAEIVMDQYNENLIFTKSKFKFIDPTAKPKPQNQFIAQLGKWGDRVRQTFQRKSRPIQGAQPLQEEENKAHVENARSFPPRFNGIVNVRHDPAYDNDFGGYIISNKNYSMTLPSRDPNLLRAANKNKTEGSDNSKVADAEEFYASDVRKRARHIKYLHSLVETSREFSMTMQDGIITRIEPASDKEIAPNKRALQSLSIEKPVIGPSPAVLKVLGGASREPASRSSSMDIKRER